MTSLGSVAVSVILAYQIVHFASEREQYSKANTSMEISFIYDGISHSGVLGTRWSIENPSKRLAPSRKKKPIRKKPRH
jgi:hypothetical protein